MARSLKKGQETWSSPRFKGPYAELVFPAKPVSWPLCVNHCHCSYPNFAGTRSEYLTPVGPAAFTQHLSLTLREPFQAFMRGLGRPSASVPNLLPCLSNLLYLLLQPPHHPLPPAPRAGCSLPSEAIPPTGTKQGRSGKGQLLLPLRFSRATTRSM